MSWKISLAEPDLGEEEILAVTNVLKSKWLTMGEITSRFEKEFATKMNVKHAFAVNNCTAALHLANVALGINDKSEVICPALTFVASANATKYTGGKVVFADSVSECDLTVSPEDIEKKITPRTKAITVVHYAGFPCDMEPILRLADKYKLKIIEDCAHAPFAKYKFSDNNEKYVGTIGDVGCFSFFSNKNMTTGEGGMITTNSDELAEKIKLFRSHGMTSLTYDRHKGHANNYDVVLNGYNYRIDEIHSAIGLIQLSKVDSYNSKRRKIFKWYIEKLSVNPNIIVPFSARDLDYATCHIMVIIVKENYPEIKQRLKDAGVQTSKHYDLIPTFTAFADSHFESKLKYISNILTLPMYPGLTKDDIDFIGDIING
jgi:dTDP-4-amino-4,6-dideoxygalactose transaminase